MGVSVFMRTIAKYFFLSFIASGFFSSVFAYEVTTHQELTRRAIGGENRAENLKFFLRTFNLIGETASDPSEDYSGVGNITLHWIAGALTTVTATGSYHDVTTALTNDPSVNLQITLPDNYLGTIEAGTILEDSATSTRGIDLTHGRFNRHFYDIHEAGCYGLKGIATCSRNWGFDGGGANDENLFSWVRAHNYFIDAIIGRTEADRKLAQANLFMSVGHISHLLQDLTQPSHARNDSHPGGGAGHLAGGSTALEPWASRAFNAREASTVPSINSSISAEPDHNITGYYAVFDDIARFTHDNFFSDDTIVGQLSDGDHGSPFQNNIFETRIDPANEFFFYMNSTGLTIPAGTRLAIHEVNRFWFDNYSLNRAINDSIDETVLEDNVSLLFPKAIAYVEGFVNFVFRGRILATIDENDGNVLVLKNITDQSELALGVDTTIKKDAKIHVLYKTASGLHVPLLGIQTLDTDLAVNQEFQINGISDAINNVSDTNLADDVRISDDNTIIVAVDGLMGGNDSQENWVVAGTTFTFLNNASALFSFDRSGSMGSDIEIAKSSALNVIPLLVSGSGNEVSVESFSTSVIVNSPYTNDFNAVKQAISGLFSGGGTALYDAIQSSGLSASARANSLPDNKSIVILYTDGLENASSTSRQAAIDAISKVTHPEIDVVYLVFVGSSVAGSNELSNIAAQAGRNFLQLNSVDQLTSELINILN